jgi:tetratricopeptide (TPR) repeat protein
VRPACSRLAATTGASSVTRMRGLARLDEAASAYATGLRFSPGQASVWEGWGDLAVAAGAGLMRRPSAIASPSACSPAADGVRRKLAQALALRGEGAAAGRELAAVKDSGKADDAKAWNNVGTGEEKAGRYREAEQAYRKALAIDPELPEAWHNLGLVLRRSGRDDEATKAFEKAIELNPRADRCDDHACRIATTRRAKFRRRRTCGTGV